MSKETKTARFLWGLLREHKLLALVAGASLLCVSAATLLFPFIIRTCLDHGLAQGRGAVLMYSLFLAASGLFLSVSSGARIFSAHCLVEKIIMSTEERVYAHLLFQKPDFFLRKPLSDIFSLILSDMARLRVLLTSSVSLFLRNVFLFFGAVGIMLYSSIYFSLIACALILFIVLPIIFMVRSIKSFSRQACRAGVDVHQHIRETLESLDLVQSFLAEPLELKVCQQFSQAAFSKARRYIFSRALATTIAFFMGISGIVFIFWLGLSWVASGQMSVGIFIQFLISAFIAAASLAALSESMSEFENVTSIASRIMDLLSYGEHTTLPLPEEASRSRRAVIFGGDGAEKKPKILFKDVSFAYPAQKEHWALRNVNLQLEGNQLVGIVGPSGGGKSTLFKLMMGFYVPTKGTISIAGQTGPEALRNFCAKVPQDAVLFNRSILDNIRYGAPDALMQDIEMAAHQAQIDSFIHSLPEGYNTLCGERGCHFSVGQRQRIAIARAILVKAPVLLLDEYTSGLDVESEHHVMRAIDTISRHRLVFVIAHRLHTIQRANHIIFLDEGRIVLQGTHQELSSYENPYSTFLKRQGGPNT